VPHEVSVTFQEPSTGQWHNVPSKRAGRAKLMTEEEARAYALRPGGPGIGKGFPSVQAAVRAAKARSDKATPEVKPKAKSADTALRRP
jgi:hypothetical protein